MNIELLEKVKAHILEEPRRFYMMAILHRRSDEEKDINLYPACGTIGCFAGWTCVLAGSSDISGGTARNILGLTKEQAGRLFYGSPEDWSGEDSARLWSCDGSPETAALAAARIDLFIASGGEK